jgi:hypothetical protein
MGRAVALVTLLACAGGCWIFEGVAEGPFGFCPGEGLIGGADQPTVAFALPGYTLRTPVVQPQGHDAGDFFFVSERGGELTIWNKDWAPSAAPEAFLEGLSPPSTLALDTTHLYFAWDKAVWRMRADGSEAAAPVVTGLAKTPGGLAVDEEQLYIGLFLDGLFRTPKRGGQLERVADDWISGLVAAGDSVIAFFVASGRWELRRYDRTGAMRVLATVRLPGALALDGAHAFFIDQGTQTFTEDREGASPTGCAVSGDASVWRVAADGATPAEALATEVALAEGSETSLAVIGGRAYVSARHPGCCGNGIARADGSLEHLFWGFSEPIGMLFAPGPSLYFVIDNGSTTRASYLFP